MLDVALQIDRLEVINREIEAYIRSDELDSIQALVDEREARISQLVEFQQSGKADVFKAFFNRLSAIQKGGEELARLVELKLKVIRNELRKTGDAQTISKGYAGGSPQLVAESRRTTDLTG